MVIARINLLTSLIKLKPFDVTTLEGRSKERYRRVALTGIMSLVAKGVSVLTGLISVPLTLNYLGKERFGLWATISSIEILLVFADFGLGNGLLNAISEADGRNDEGNARQAVTSIFFILSGIAALILILFGIIYPFIPWPRVFNVVTPFAIRESGPAMAVFMFCFALNLPFGIVQRVQTGYQQGFVNNLWQMAGSIFSLIGVLIVIHFKLGLPWLVMAFCGISTLVTIINWVVQFGLIRKWLWPHWLDFQWSTGRNIAGKGVIFLGLTLFSLLGTSTDNIIVAQILGASAVATLAVMARLFLVAHLAENIFNPLWPAFGEALERGDIIWVQRAFKRSLFLSLGLGASVGLFMIFISRPVIAIWVGRDMLPSMSLVYSFAVWGLLASVSSVLVSLLNTSMFLNKQLLLGGIAATVSLILKIILTHALDISGVVWATVIGFGVFFILPGIILAVRQLFWIKQ